MLSLFSKSKRFGMLLSVSKWRRILRGKTETKSAPKTIFSGNGNGLKEFNFKYTRTKECPHSVCKTRLRAFVYVFKPGTLTIEGQQTPVGVGSSVLFCVQNQWGHRWKKLSKKLSVFPRTPRNTGVYTRHPTFVTATSGMLTRHPTFVTATSGMLTRLPA